MLNIDAYFHKALSKDAEVVRLTGGRIFNPACKEKDMEGPFPYIIVKLKSLSSSGGTKDGRMSDIDSGVVEMLVVGKERKDVAKLTKAAHAAIRAYAEHSQGDQYDFVMDIIRPSADEVVYDDLFDCCAQAITYSCDVTPID